MYINKLYLLFDIQIKSKVSINAAYVQKAQSKNSKAFGGPKFSTKPGKPKAANIYLNGRPEAKCTEQLKQQFNNLMKKDVNVNKVRDS